MAIFLECTNSALLDEDTAIQALEQLAAELQQMAEADRQMLAKDIVALSASYGQPHRVFVEGLPAVLGLR